MTDALKGLIAKAASGAPLTREEAARGFHTMMSGEATPSQMGGLLMALRVRGETVDEITGAVTAMREKMVRVRSMLLGRAVMHRGPSISRPAPPWSWPAPAFLLQSMATALCLRAQARPTFWRRSV